jgi:hypothetical protein
MNRIRDEKPARRIFALALLAWSAAAGCDKKSDAPAPTASAAAAPAAASCPAGSNKDGNGCKGTRTARVATLAWNRVVGDSSQTLTARNTAGSPLKDAKVALWFYDVTGRRLDISGSKKYTVPGDALGTTLNAGATKDIIVSVAKATLPTGTAEIEGEVVKATLVNPDGTDGPTWENDDLNADDRAMASAPPPGAAAAAAAGIPTAPAAATGPTGTALTRPPPSSAAHSATERRPPAMAAPPPRHH